MIETSVVMIETPEVNLGCHQLGYRKDSDARASVRPKLKCEKHALLPVLVALLRSFCKQMDPATDLADTQRLLADARAKLLEPTIAANPDDLKYWRGREERLAEKELLLLKQKAPVRGDFKPLCIELHKKGSTARNHPSFEMEPPYTIQDVYAYLEDMVDALKYEDINLTRLRDARLLDAASFHHLAHQHAAQGMPVLIEWESASKACSALKPKEGLTLLGLPEEYEAVREDAALFPVDHAEFLPDSIREVIPRLNASRPATIDDLFNHFAADLHLRQRVSDPVEGPKEYTRRELISPVLYCAASLIPDIAVLAEAEVKGQRSHGTIDYVLDHLGVSVICVEAKLFEQLLDHLGQLCGEVRASRDVLRRKVLGKRKFGSISLSTEEEQALGKLKKMPTAGLLSNGIQYITFQYTEDPLELGGPTKPRATTKAKWEKDEATNRVIIEAEKAINEARQKLKPLLRSHSGGNGPTDASGSSGAEAATIWVEHYETNPYSPASIGPDPSFSVNLLAAEGKFLGAGQLNNSAAVRHLLPESGALLRRTSSV
ncbi:hypothetical protein WJX72_007593 [[Myrmecia] bisecta]|uniref:Uncharacterized protein n=1 Tax=[Myrmecia] bisecta TaxID=41462 RepID=A0AAW1PY85_9CHLO